MKTIVLSDIHGQMLDGHLPLELEEFDLILICGDVCPTWNHGVKFQYEWLCNEFSKFINKLPFKDANSRVVMIAGNHDFVFQNISKTKLNEFYSKIDDNRLVYLDNEEYIFSPDGIKEYKIFGCPYCKVFGNWAFMRENLDEYYSEIPEELDILITHDAANINGLGEIKMGQWTGVNAGNDVLWDYIKERKPKYYFCGHIHSGTHGLTEIEGIKMANVSLLDEHYNFSYKPLIINM